MLDAHPALAIPPETGFLTQGKLLQGEGDALRERFFQTITTFPAEMPAWPDFHIPGAAFAARLREVEPFSVAEGFRAFYRMYAARFGKSRWGDKTPTYCRHLLDIQDLFPEARFIHLIRDGRDAAVSLRQRWFSPGHDIGTQARFWRENVSAARRQAPACRHYREVRYEDLVRSPEPVLASLCDFLELPYDEAMLAYHQRAPARLAEHLARHRADGSVVVTHEERLKQQVKTQEPPDPGRIGAWRGTLTAEELREFEAVAGDTLQQCGYPLAG